MGNIYTVDSTLFSPDIPTRLDMRTAALLEHALSLQEMAGTGTAALFLHCHDVALATALRVLSTGPRRQSAAPHLFARLRPRTGNSHDATAIDATSMLHPSHSKLSESTP